MPRYGIRRKASGPGIRQFSVPEIELQVTPAPRRARRASEIAGTSRILSAPRPRHPRPSFSPASSSLATIDRADRPLSFPPASSGVALSGASFRPSPPNNRLGIHLIDRFTAPEDILLLRYTRHVSLLALLLTLFPSFRVQLDDYPSLRNELVVVSWDTGEGSW